MAYPTAVARFPVSLAQRMAHAAQAQRHFTLIAIVFLVFRLLMPLGFTSLGPDVGQYLRWGALADSHLYPYIHYWSEYPPLFSWSAIALYRLSTLAPMWPLDPPFWFGLVLKTTLALFDLGNLILVYAIALQLGHKARAIRTAALFAGGFITAYAAWGWYDTLPLFFLLLALYWALRDRPVAGAVAAAVGMLIKVVPIVIAPTALRRIPGLRGRARYILALGATILALLLPFLIANAPYVAAFVRGTFNRPAWGSLWAMLEGNYDFGQVAPVVERFSLESADAAPPVESLPWPIIHLAFAGLFLFLYTRPIDWREPRQAVAFAGLTVNLFLLWSKGFSGQFTVYAFPFIVLLMPNRRGVLYAGLLSVLWIAEWPSALFAQPADTQTPNYFLLWLTVTRTAIWIALCLEYAARLFPRAAARLPRAAQAILIASWLSVAPVSVLLIDTYTRNQLAADPAAPALYLIRDRDSAGKTIVLATSRIFRRLYPLAQRVGETLLLPSANHVPPDVRLAWLNQLAARGPFWFVADESDAGALDENRQAEAWVAEHTCKVETQIAGSARVSRFVGAAETPIALEAAAVFADEIELTGARLDPQTPRPGAGVCLELDWRALAPPAGDYTIFVHLIDAQGRLVAQNDQPPRGGFAPTSGWEAGRTVTDKHGLILPAALPPGNYSVQIGLYRSDDQSPVRITRGDRAALDAAAIHLSNVSVVP
ncbi:MAG TPA: hypothetical protein VJG32_09425 [Anaerolineae bacterium]|nr:hypothetical protein [Anaerolineae bacterium]